MGCRQTVWLLLCGGLWTACATSGDDLRKQYLASYIEACRAGNPVKCQNAASMLFDDGDRSRARELGAIGCEQHLRSIREHDASGWYPLVCIDLMSNKLVDEHEQVRIGNEGCDPAKKNGLAMCSLAIAAAKALGQPQLARPSLARRLEFSIQECSKLGDVEAARATGYDVCKDLREEVPNDPEVKEIIAQRGPLAGKLEAYWQSEAEHRDAVFAARAAAIRARRKSAPESANGVTAQGSDAAAREGSRRLVASSLNPAAFNVSCIHNSPGKARGAVRDITWYRGWDGEHMLIFYGLGWVEDDGHLNGAAGIERRTGTARERGPPHDGRACQRSVASDELGAIAGDRFWPPET